MWTAGGNGVALPDLVGKSVDGAREWRCAAGVRGGNGVDDGGEARWERVGDGETYRGRPK